MEEAARRYDLGHVSAAGSDEDGVQRLTGGHEEPVALGPAEAEVGADLREKDHADAVSLGREDVNAIVARTTIGRGPDVSVDVDTHAVGAPGFAVQLHVGEL